VYVTRSNVNKKLTRTRGGGKENERRRKYDE
jgi:hypothetical protein